MGLRWREHNILQVLGNWILSMEHFAIVLNIIINVGAEDAVRELVEVLFRRCHTEKRSRSCLSGRSKLLGRVINSRLGLAKYLNLRRVLLLLVNVIHW